MMHNSNTEEDMGSKVCFCVRGLRMVCGGEHAATGARRRVWEASVTKCSKVYRSGPVCSVCKDRSHQSLKPVFVCFLELLLHLRKPLKPSFQPPFKTLDPVLAQQVMFFLQDQTGPPSVLVPKGI